MKILKNIFLLSLFLAVSCSKQDESNMTEDQFNTLIAQSVKDLQIKIDNCKSEFKIGTYKRFDWNQETGELIWSDDGVKKVIAKVQFVGSVSTISNTWLWSWENPSILDGMKNEMNKVKAFGKENKIEKLTTAKWPAEEVDGWEMTAIAAHILKAKGAYRSPGKTGFTFMVFTDIYWANEKEKSSNKTDVPDSTKASPEI